MKPENLSDLSGEELSAKIKQIKKSKVIDATIIGFTIGIVVFSAVKYGFGFFTFAPLILTFIILRNSRNNKIKEQELEEELRSRAGN